MALTFSAADLVGLLVAVLGGAAVGMERQRSGHAEGPTAHFGGIRTFTLLGAVSGVAGWLFSHAVAVVAILLVAGVVGVIVTGYAAASRRDVDATTEVAAVLLVAVGFLSGMGLFRIASGIIALEVLLLIEKTRLHSVVRRLDDVELRAGVRFAVMAFVILPLLPEGPYPPFGAVRPRQLWLLVLFFSGLSFLGRVLHRIIGPRSGYLVSGTIGGLVSSTNVTFTFAKSSQQNPAAAPALAGGAIAANAVLYARVFVAIGVLHPPLLPLLVAYLLPPALVVTIGAAVAARARGGQESGAALHRNPLQLAAALQMAALFQLVLIVVRALQGALGKAGILATAAVLGLTDVDALTVSMAKGLPPDVSLATAAVAIAVGVLANTGLKATVALVLGQRRFGVAVAGTLLLSAAAGVSAIALLPRL
jgi:uncharacterized membrane protein (DUF4010 family)